MKVKNLNGTSKNKCEICKSWITHWENLSGEKSDKCCCKGCTNNAVYGGHVQKDTSDNSWYIIPLCESCNKKPSSESFEINKNTILVTAVACK